MAQCPTNNSDNFMNTNTDSNLTNQFDTVSSGRSSITRAPINFNNAELKYFEKLFSLVTSDGLSAAGKNIVPLFRSTGVANNVLKEIWQKSATNTEAQSKSEFYCAVLLLGLAQNGHALTKDNLMNPRTRFIPKLPTTEIPEELQIQNEKVRRCLETGEPLDPNSSPSGQTKLKVESGSKKGNLREESPDFVDRLRDTFTGGRHSFFEAESDEDEPKTRGIDLPEVTPKGLEKYERFVRTTKTSEAGILKGSEAVNIFSQSKLTKKQLSTVWNLVDRGQKGLLNASEFILAVYQIELVKKGYEMPTKLPPHLLTFMLNYDAQKMGASCIEHEAPKSEENEDTNSDEKRRKANKADKSIEQLEDESRDGIIVGYSRPVDHVSSLGSDGLGFLKEVMESYEVMNKKHADEMESFNTEMQQIEGNASERMHQIYNTLKEIDIAMEQRDVLRDGLFEGLKLIGGYLLDDHLRSNCSEITNDQRELQDLQQMKVFVEQRNCKQNSLSFGDDSNTNPFQNDQNENLDGGNNQVEQSPPKLSNEEFDSELENMFGF